jgi:ribosomal-protein-alanine N-acetyltransferase
MKIRCLTMDDKPHILAIEKQSFATPWTWEDFMQLLDHRNAFGKVATTNSGKVLGYMVYELNTDNVRLVNMAVHPDIRNQGIGSQMLEHLRLCLSTKRKRLLAEVWEYDLTSQKFFRKNKFVAYSVMRDYYGDGTDAYAFRFSLNAADEVYIHPWIPTGRIVI